MLNPYFRLIYNAFLVNRETRQFFNIDITMVGHVIFAALKIT